MWKRAALARERGFSFSQDSVAAGVMAIGIVVSQPDALQALALSVSMPAAQLSDDDQMRIGATIREIVRPESSGLRTAPVGEAQTA